MNRMFAYSKFNQDISQWDTSKVKNMSDMFAGSAFQRDISKWNISDLNNFENMFTSNHIFIPPWANINTETLLKNKNTLILKQEIENKLEHKIKSKNLKI